jgi:hypothetical protein
LPTSPELPKSPKLKATNSEPNFTMGESDKRAGELISIFGISGDLGNVGNLA